MIRQIITHSRVSEGGKETDTLGVFGKQESHVPRGHEASCHTSAERTIPALLLGAVRGEKLWLPSPPASTPKAATGHGRWYRQSSLHFQRESVMVEEILIASPDNPFIPAALCWEVMGSFSK